MSEIWRELERRGPESVVVDGAELRRGSRVRLRPRPGRDAWDSMLAGKDALVESVEEEVDGGIQLVVSLFEDAGRDLGAARPGHRFFFAPDELEPLTQTRVLVAGIGNVFLGDDGFGCAVAAALADEPLPPGAEAADFGIRGLDLAYALGAYDAAVLIDAVPLGETPGTLAVIEPELGEDEAAEIETHGMDPARVLRLARELKTLPARTLVVGCEPQTAVDPDAEHVLVELSAPVRDAVGPAASLVRDLVAQLVEEEPKEEASR